VIPLTLNGERRELEVEPDKPLLWVLREDLGLVGTKYGCGVAACGACTVHVDGQAMRSCQIPVESVGKAKISTIEGMSKNAVGKKVQAAWMELDVAQCGYCQAGQIMSATALLSKTAKPTDAQIDEAMNGNICRCATYVRIRAAIKRASGQKEV
jgi:isoquinoline 1-oxidoreductase alpha subunit